MTDRRQDPETRSRLDEIEAAYKAAINRLAKRLAFGLAIVAGACIAGILMTQNNGVRDNERDYRNQVDSCIRGRDIRGELNARAPTHMLDAQNLERLTRRLSKTRDREARVFWLLGQRFGMSRELDSLVNTYLAAKHDDLKIAESQATVSFGTLSMANCLETVKRP